MAKNVKVNAGIDTVDPARVEAAIASKAIGQKIRRLRLKRSMGLAELGQQVGLSASFLSQLETGRVIPTMRNLARIAMAFKKDFAYFLAEEEDSLVFRVSRAKDRIRLTIEDKGTIVLKTDNMGMLLQNPKTVPCIAQFLPGPDGTLFRPRIFPGLELVYVISGPLVLSTDLQTEVLHSEDSAWIDSNTSRQYRCHDDQPATAMIMTFAL